MREYLDFVGPNVALDTNEWHRQYGAPWPLGVRWVARENAINFAIYSKHATSVELLFFCDKELDRPVRVVNLDAWHHKSGPIWHVRVPAVDLKNAKYYSYRVDGPQPEGEFELHQFDVEKLLLDPYAKDIYFPPQFDRQLACRPGSNMGHAPLGVLPVVEKRFDWGDDAPIRHGSDLVIYELHVRGFTQRPNSGIDEKRRGTFLGV